MVPAAEVEGFAGNRRGWENCGRLVLRLAEILVALFTRLLKITAYLVVGIFVGAGQLVEGKHWPLSSCNCLIIHCISSILVAECTLIGRRDMLLEVRRSHLNVWRVLRAGLVWKRLSCVTTKNQDQRLGWGRRK